MLHPLSLQVRVAASLPCYSTKNVDEQRGRGVFERSIRGLQLLNAAGYGQPGSGLTLDLVYNPNGTFLAPPQADLQVGTPKPPTPLPDVVLRRLACAEETTF